MKKMFAGLLTLSLALPLAAVPAASARILVLRREMGSFRAIEDLDRVKGIGPERLRQLRGLLVVPESAPRPSAPFAGRTSTTTPSCAWSVQSKPRFEIGSSKSPL